MDEKEPMVRIRYTSCVAAKDRAYLRVFQRAINNPMNSSEIIEFLSNTHARLNEHLENQDAELFNASSDGKWSTAEHVIHLTKSIAPLFNALTKPKFILRYMFGKPNRGVRTYDEVKSRYYMKLADVPLGVTSPFVPNENDDLTKEKVLAQYRSEQDRLHRVIGKWKDRKLDKYLLPHPLLGKVLVREMLYFTDFHTMHHMDIIKNMK